MAAQYSALLVFQLRCLVALSQPLDVLVPYRRLSIHLDRESYGWIDGLFIDRSEPGQRLHLAGHRILPETRAGVCPTLQSMPLILGSMQYPKDMKQKRA
jgi:hypothetical protein